MTRCPNNEETPTSAFPGVLRHLNRDIFAGFLVFLIALPLCVGISIASGCPAIAGILTAAIGGLVTPFLSDSELTIKGPAAGMIAIVLGAVAAFTPEIAGDPSAAALEGYRKMLGLAVVSGGLQVLLGIFRLGALGEFFPVPAVQGMLAAIGLVIISKQTHLLLLGSAVNGGVFQLLAAIPDSIKAMHGPSGIIGLSGLFLLAAYRSIRFRLVQAVPAPIWLLLFGMPAAFSLGVPEAQLVRLPHTLAGALTTPDFSGVATLEGIKWILLLAVVGSLESVLSAKAVDTLDPWNRRTDLNKDLFAVGVANLLAALVGGMPMISEIVRSSASRNYGARTRWANFFHAVFLLLFVAAVPALLAHLPLSALAAMLVFAGCQLASPVRFVSMYRTGRAEFAVFLVTVFATLLTDLLVGICAGVLTQWLLLARAVRANPFKARYSVKQEPDFVRFKVHGALMFSNWLSLVGALRSGGVSLVLDVSEATLVDYSVMTKLTEFQTEWEHRGRIFRLEGLDRLRAASAEPLARRTNGATPVHAEELATRV
jgi:MFS superfamily sulfate permease-like transporter